MSQRSPSMAALKASRADTDPGNVVPFIRPAGDRANTSSDVVLRRGERPGIFMRERRLWFACLFAVSLVIHGGLFLAAFLHEPKPLASIGLEAISVELVLGAQNPAGPATTPGPDEVQSPARENELQEDTQPEPTTTAQQQDVPVERPVETETTEAKIEEPRPVESPPREPAVVMVETPQAEVPTSSIPPPPATEVTLLPAPEPKPSVAKPQPATKPRPVQTKQQPVERGEKRTRVAARTTTERPNPQPASRSIPASAANSIGIGRSDLDTNYRGLVAAHLARQKQYPAEARSRGDQGTATVAFSLDGGGRVTSVRLARGSGVGSLDQEVQAMVRRANPFPAPPSGRSMSFSVPVSFRLN
jgi:periplasmic protein TonB